MCEGKHSKQEQSETSECDRLRRIVNRLGILLLDSFFVRISVAEVFAGDELHKNARMI